MAKKKNVLKVQDRQLSTIKPYPRNPRVNDSSIDSVAASIHDFGFRKPIVVDKKGVIICGHTCYEAALRLGLESAPVHVASDMTPQQVRAYRLADNKAGESSYWDDVLLQAEASAIEDFDLTRFGFDLEELIAGETELLEIDLSRPPEMAWALVGVPAVQFGRIADLIEQLSKVDGVTVETTVTDG